MVLFILSWLLLKTWFPAGSERSVSCSFPAGKVFRGESVRGGRRKKPPWPASRGVPEKGRTTPLCFEGLKVTHFGISSIYLYNCRKLLQFRGREKRVVNAKKRGLRPEFSGGSPAMTDFAAVYCLDIYGKTVFRILLQKARKPA